jgi:cytochrome c553
MSVLDNWKQWEDFLADRLHQAQGEGMSEGAISALALQIGDYLSEQVEPKNEQERILADLWSVADKEEQQAIANIMVKLIQNNGSR